MAKLSAVYHHAARRSQKSPRRSVNGRGDDSDRVLAKTPSQWPCGSTRTHEARRVSHRAVCDRPWQQWSRRVREPSGLVRARRRHRLPRPTPCRPVDRSATLQDFGADRRPMAPVRRQDARYASRAGSIVVTIFLVQEIGPQRMLAGCTRTEDDVWGSGSHHASVYTFVILQGHTCRPLDLPGCCVGAPCTRARVLAPWLHVWRGSRELVARES